MKKIHLFKKKQFSDKFSTSLSDNQIYPDFCLKASNDIEVFNKFRQNKIYKDVLEHVTYIQGEKYLNEIIKFPEIIKNIDFLKKNDEFGGPELKYYPLAGNFSPSTLRYIKVLCDLKSLFNDLNELKICEIGVGYGGQCRIINSLYSPDAYCLVDLKPALMLAQRYLDNFILNSVVEYKTMNELEIKNYDLVISNYSFTELPGNIQNVYLKKVILNSAKGYITYNEITPVSFHSYTRNELIKLIPGSKIIDEVPLTHPKNCIITWG